MSDNEKLKITVNVHNATVRAVNQYDDFLTVELSNGKQYDNVTLFFADKAAVAGFIASLAVKFSELTDVQLQAV